MPGATSTGKKPVPFLHVRSEIGGHCGGGQQHSETKTLMFNTFLKI